MSSLSLIRSSWWIFFFVLTLFFAFWVFQSFKRNCILIYNDAIATNIWVDSKCYQTVITKRFNLVWKKKIIEVHKFFGLGRVYLCMCTTPNALSHSMIIERNHTSAKCETWEFFHREPLDSKRKCVCVVSKSIEAGSQFEIYKQQQKKSSIISK